MTDEDKELKKQQLVFLKREFSRFSINAKQDPKLYAEVLSALTNQINLLTKELS